MTHTRGPLPATAVTGTEAGETPPGAGRRSRPHPLRDRRRQIHRRKTERRLRSTDSVLLDTRDYRERRRKTRRKSDRVNGCDHYPRVSPARLITRGIDVYL